MIKKLFFSVILVFAMTFGFSQTVIFEDDFETYEVGSTAGATGVWTTWNGTVGFANDAVISNAQNHTSPGAKSMYVKKDNDIVYYFGDKKDGDYEVEFYYYVPTGKSGYFNVEHEFGNVWAFSINFNAGGAGVLNHNVGQEQIFTFSHDVWFLVKLHFDIDNDLVTVNVGETEVKSWEFSTQEGTTTGTPSNSNILDCINFYGGDASGVFDYYVDDFKYIELKSGTLPQEIEVNVTEITTDGASANFVISNTGQDILTYKAYAYYPEATPTKELSNSNYSKNNIVLLNSFEETTPIKIKNDAKAEYLMHFAEDAATGGTMGWKTTQLMTVSAAVLFDHNKIKEHIGKNVIGLIIYGGALPEGTPTAKVWEGYNLLFNGPTDLKASKDFSYAENSFITVELDAPVFVSGKDLWVGWTFTQKIYNEPDGVPSVYCLGLMDQTVTPTVPGVNYIQGGVVWDVVDNMGNFAIGAILDGSPITTWLTIDEPTGEIPGAGTQEIGVSFTTEGLPYGTHTSTIVIQNNDNNEHWYEIPVTLDIINSVENTAKIGVMTFPNPAYSELNVVANENINKIVVTDLSGKVVSVLNPNTSSTSVNISNLSKGIYIVKVITNNVESTQKVIIK